MASSVLARLPRTSKRRSGCGAAVADTMIAGTTTGDRTVSGVTLRVGTRATPRVELEGVVLGGRYRLSERIGAGAMGDVYRALHAHLGRPCAVKVLRIDDVRDADSAEQRRRFLAEAKALASLDHASVVRVWDFGREHVDAGGSARDVAYLVTELAEGEDLIDRIRVRGALPQGEAAVIVREVVSALAYVHDKGIVHRDVKPENVRVRIVSTTGGAPSAAVKLLDFGTARTNDDEDDDGPMWVGTPAYMSPEQAQGLPVDGRTDLYACGVLLFELLTGRLPFDHADPASTAAAHVECRPPRPSSIRRDLDPELESIVLWCLRKPADQRPQTARELRDALDRWLGAAAAPREPRPASTRRRSRRLAFAVGAIAIVALPFAVAVRTFSPDASVEPSAPPAPPPAEPAPPPAPIGRPTSAVASPREPPPSATSSHEREAFPEEHPARVVRSAPAEVARTAARTTVARAKRPAGSDPGSTLRARPSAAPEGEASPESTADPYADAPVSDLVADTAVTPAPSVRSDAPEATPASVPPEPTP